MILNHDFKSNDFKSFPTLVLIFMTSYEVRFQFTEDAQMAAASAIVRQVIVVRAFCTQHGCWSVLVLAGVDALSMQRRV